LGPVLSKINFVLFVGWRHSYKNFHVAVQAIAARPDYWLVSVGGETLNPRERQLLQTHLPNRHVHLPAVDDEHLNHLYNYAHALLYPSSYEGFGLPVLEAMAAGCPVIATNASSIPEVCGDAGLLVDGALPDVLADKITGLQNSEFRSEIIAKGYRQAKRFSWEKCYRETMSFYEQVMRENNIPILHTRETKK
jgi:mannosyltransferase